MSELGEEYAPEGAEDFVARKTGGTSQEAINNASHPSPEYGEVNLLQDTGENSPTTEEDKAQEYQERIYKQILDKMTDVLLPGTAFSSLSLPPNPEDAAENGVGIEKFKHFEEVMRNGLIGAGGESSGIYSSADRIELWKKHVADRDVHQSRVWFNIVGRMEEKFAHKYRDIDKNDLEKGYGGVIVTFDLSKFNELPPGQLDSLEKRGGKGVNSITFSADKQTLSTFRPFAKETGQYAYERVKAMGQKTPFQSTFKSDPVFGFETPYRVSAGLFTGIILNEYYQQYLPQIVESLQAADAERPDRLVPIYDSKGNMLWPTQMSVEQIRDQLEAKKQPEG